MCSLLNAFKLVLDAPFLKPFPAVVRWFTTLKEQPEVREANADTRVAAWAAVGMCRAMAAIARALMACALMVHALMSCS